MKVNLLSLKGQYGKIEKEVLDGIKKVCASQHFILGENVRGLEEEIAKYLGAGYAVGVASGSDALILSLMALGVGYGDTVITTPYTFFSTAGSIAILGARPVFVDIDPLTYNMDTEKLESALKKDRAGKIKAVIPVHLYGQCADMTRINKMAKGYGVKTIEDAAQSIGATHRGKKGGSIGDTGCLSFYPTKNLGGFGDGGMVTTNSKTLAEKVRVLRVHGSKVRYYHELVGVNSRLDEIQAAVLRVKLKYLDGWTEKRVKNAGYYSLLFERAGLLDYATPPHIEDSNSSVFNQYVIRAKKRDKLREYLKEKGIGTELYYPLPLHLQKCFKYLGYKRGDFPVSEKAAKQTLALPIYPELKKSEIDYVVSTIKDFCDFYGG